MKIRGRVTEWVVGTILGPDMSGNAIEVIAIEFDSATGTTDVQFRKTGKPLITFEPNPYIDGTMDDQRRRLQRRQQVTDETEQR